MGKHLLVRYRCILPGNDGTDAEPCGYSYHHHSDCFLFSSSEETTKLIYEWWVLAALKTLEACKINNVRACSAPVYLCNRASDSIFLKLQAAKIFLSVWEDFLLQHSNSFDIKNPEGPAHKLYQTCKASASLTSQTSPSTAIQAATHFTYNVSMYHLNHIINTWQHQKMDLWKQPPPQRKMPPLQPWQG